MCIPDRYSTLQNTVFGYIVFGKKSAKSCNQCDFSTESIVWLDRQMEPFWQSKREQVPSSKQNLKRTKIVNVALLKISPETSTVALSSLYNSVMTKCHYIRRFYADMAMQWFYNIERTLQRVTELIFSNSCRNIWSLVTWMNYMSCKCQGSTVLIANY